MAYACVKDIKKRMTREISDEEACLCATLLDDVAVLIDSINENASADAKRIVSCRAVIRMLGSGSENDISIPMGVSQGSMSALGYSQSWTIGNGGSIGEIYLTKVEKQLLGAGNKIGSYSPVEELCCRKRRK